MNSELIKLIQDGWHVTISCNAGGQWRGDFVHRLYFNTIADGMSFEEMMAAAVKQIGYQK